MRFILKYRLTTILLLISAAVYSQDPKQEPTPGSLTEEIEVVRPYKPVLADAVKIRRNPDLTTTRPFKPNLTYNIIDKKLELNTGIRELQAQKLPEERPDVLLNNYAKIGLGNLNTGLGELYIGTGEDIALQAGVYVKHLSQSGDITKQRFSNQSLGVFGRSIGDIHTVTGRASFDQRSSYFYGFNPAIPSTTDPDKQRFNLIEAEGEFFNNYSDEADLFNYALKASGYLLSNINDGRENSIALSTYLNKAFNNFNIGLNASADFTGTKDTQYSIGNHILRGNPYVKFQGNGFLLNLGLNIVQEMGDNSRTNILPAASVELPISAEYAIVFAGFKGDVLKSSLRDFSYENLFLNNNITIKNAVEKANAYAGVKGNAGAGFGYKVMAFYKKIEDMPLFVNNSVDVNRFDVIYDDGEAKVIGFEGEINIKASDIFTVGGKVQMNQYDMESEKEAWFKPGFRITSNLRANINSKLSFDGELLFNGDSYAKITDFTTTPPTENSSLRINSFMDLSAGAEYRLNNKFGIYARVNNIFGNQYQQYLYYPKLGLNIFGGLNYSF
ncbi:MAG TPA: TonB-dependent receptor [Sphingobacteriaceae bacterium]